MSMIVNHSFDSHFVSLLEKLQKKYGEEMFKLERNFKRQFRY